MSKSLQYGKFALAAAAFTFAGLALTGCDTKTHSAKETTVTKTETPQQTTKTTETVEKKVETNPK